MFRFVGQGLAPAFFSVLVLAKRWNVGTNNRMTKLTDSFKHYHSEKIAGRVSSKEEPSGKFFAHMAIGSIRLSCSCSLSAIRAINSELVGLPFVLETV